MPVFKLSDKMIFPNPELANKEGIVAIGGDLSSERLLLAYSNGIFPWFSQGEPIIWWSPDPRFVLFPLEINISRSMTKFLNKKIYKVTFDTVFHDVISYCSELRTEGTWITQEMINAYCALYNLGYAHSVEVWYEDKLVGGLYGISLGKCFFGESMFSIMDNASKTALVKLGTKLIEKGFLFIDCQVYSKHLESMGAVHILRKSFLAKLREGLSHKTLKGAWHCFN